MTRNLKAQTGDYSTLFARLGNIGGGAAVLLTGWLAFSQSVSAPSAPANNCNGYLRGRIFGALAMELDWSGNKLSCAGMSRPDGKGIRLHLAWDQGNDERLVLLVGIEGDATPVEGLEKPANVTFIDERSGKFYSSGGTGRCWTDITRLASLPARDGSRQLKGRLYCTGALPSLNDHSSLTLGDLDYYGQFAFDDN
jgi:hypothetical protein